MGVAVGGTMGGVGVAMEGSGSGSNGRQWEGQWKTVGVEGGGAMGEDTQQAHLQ